MQDEKLGASFYSLKSRLFSSYKDGFYVYAKKEKQSIVKDSINYVVRYTGKPPMAQSRIIDYDGEFVTFYYQRHEDGKRVTEKLSAIDFIKRLIVHIPDKQFKMVRYYGLYAKKHKHSSKIFLLVSKQKQKFYKQLANWRGRLLLAFGIDPLHCSCGNTMELLDIFLPKKHSDIDYRSPPIYNLN